MKLGALFTKFMISDGSGGVWGFRKAVAGKVGQLHEESSSKPENYVPELFK
jgi:hypothetical protein